VNLLWVQGAGALLLLLTIIGFLGPHSHRLIVPAIVIIIAAGALALFFEPHFNVPQDVMCGSGRYEYPC
jgi:hypothetical protein